MPKFNYIALDSRGQESTGVIEAPSQNDAVGQLRQAGFFPTTVAEEGKGGQFEVVTGDKRYCFRCAKGQEAAQVAQTINAIIRKEYQL